MWRIYNELRTQCCFTVILLLSCTPLADASDCGGFIKLKEDASGILTSPNYPDEYPSDSYCIWAFQTNTKYILNFEIVSVFGELSNNTNGCLDYFEVRDGSEESVLRYSSCLGADLPLVITSPSRWLWVKFVSDSNATTTQGGFYVRYSTTFTDIISNLTAPFPACSNAMFKCPNKECRSWTYVCDGENDCGCLVPGCDERKCVGLGFTSTEIVLIGIGGGSGVFLLLFSLIGGIEAIIAYRHRKARERENKPKRAFYTIKLPGEGAHPMKPKYPAYESKIPMLRTPSVSDASGLFSNYTSPNLSPMTTPNITPLPSPGLNRSGVFNQSLTPSPSPHPIPIITTNS